MSACFGQPARYVNEMVATPVETVARFLGALLKTETLPVVEVSARNCGLDGSPQLWLNDQEGESLAPALHQFSAVFGNPLAAIEDIESIQLYVYRKRVKMVFERAGDDAFVVRYAGQPLTTTERRAFEAMMERDYRITVLPTEKKHVR